jgi:hypothetical protein
MKEFLKSNVQSLKELDWPELTLYEIVNNMDVDESIISLISLKFFHCVMYVPYHFIYRNHRLEFQSKNIGALKTNCIYGNYSFRYIRKRKGKTLKYYCKITGGANKNVRII